MTRQARSSAVIMGFDTHMILETVPVLPSTRQNAHQTINPTSRHYAEAVRLPWNWRNYPGSTNAGRGVDAGL